MRTHKEQLKTATQAAVKSVFEYTLCEAIRLARQAKAIGEQLDALKDAIRERAAKQESRGEQVVFACKEGEVKVAFVRDECKLLKGANPRALREDLGEETWGHLFEEVVKLGDDFDAKLALLPAGERALVKKLVEWKPREARVTIGK